MNRYPTVRLDYQPSGRHRLTWSMNNQYFGGGPDFTDNREAYYPGFPVEANQSSTRRATSGWTRSTLGNTMVNEARIGYSGAPVVFAEDQFSKSLWEGSVANQGGYYLNLAQSMNFTTNIQNYMNAGPGGTTSSRDANLRMIEDSLSWLKGSHNITLGGNYTEYKLWAKNQQIVPEIRFGLVTGDPAESLFTAANFPGASATDLAVAGVSTRFSLDGSARSEGLRGSTKTPVSTSTWARGSSGQSSGSSDSGCRTHGAWATT